MLLLWEILWRLEIQCTIQILAFTTWGKQLKQNVFILNSGHKTKTECLIISLGFLIIATHLVEFCYNISCALTQVKALFYFFFHIFQMIFWIYIIPTLKCPFISVITIQCNILRKLVNNIYSRGIYLKSQ